MENKSTLGPLFVLSFLGSIVLFCVVLSISSLLLGTAYSINQISGEGRLIQPSIVAVFESEQPVLSTPSNQPEPMGAILTSSTPELPKPPVEPPSTTLPTENLIPTNTPLPIELPTQTPVPTATLDQNSIQMTRAALATQQVAGMMELVGQLYDGGLIHSTKGVYHSLPIFANESAIKDSIKKFPTGLSPKDFILRSDVNWQVDQNQGDWAESGCGIVFRESSPGDFNLVYLSLDGRARIIRSIGGSLLFLGRSTIFSIDRENGQAQLQLVVEGDMIRIFVNGEQKFIKPSEPIAGNLSFTVVTGNPYGFGTRCKMSNIEVWEIEGQ
jgi:hypothetical protein